MRQAISPEGEITGREVNNDYGVNPYYAKYKVKTGNKRESEDVVESTDYGTFNSSKETVSTTLYESQIAKKGKLKT